MSSIHSTRSRLDNKNHQLNPSGWLRLIIALSLSLLLFFAPITSNVSARQDDSIEETAEALLAVKADPLLQSVRRAALSDRVAEKVKPWWESLKAPASEVESFSRIAGVKRLPDGTVSVSLTVRLTGNSVDELEAAGFGVGARVGNIATVETEVERLPELAALASVRKLSAATYSSTTNDVARQAVGVDNASGTRAVSQTGRGIIVGVVDTGIDFRHADFTVPGTNGKQTRIKALLDMTIYTQQSSDWNYTLPGASASIGHLYTEADINAALQLPTTQDQTSDTVKERDTHGHGTFTAGIAAGNGLAGPTNGKYAGMAPEADLIIAKITRDNNGGGSSISSDNINALKFIQQKATEMGRPFVINMSLGTSVGAHDGTMDQERAIDEVVNGGTGRAVCVSAGNYGNADIHASGQLPAGNATSLNINVNAKSTPQFFGLSYALTDNLTITLFRPDGVKIGPVAYNPNQVPGASNQYVDIYNSLDDKRDADPQNDQKAVAIFFKDAAANIGSTPTRTWLVLLETGAVSNGHFDAWIENGNFTTFVDGSRRISSTATSRGAISVGGFVTRPGNRTVGDYASFTAVGPTADGREKPDISAPAYLLYSAKSSVGTSLSSLFPPDSSSYVGAAGTSAAAPVVAGSVALILQENPNLTSDQIKELIKSNATHDAFTGAATWHERFGFGKLNIAAALHALAPAQPSLQLSAATYNVNEGDGKISIVVTRDGDTTTAATINYATSDPSGLTNCNVINGIASSRCDYATSVGTLRFAAGETSKTISIPIVDDNFSEGNETFTLTLSNPVGAALGATTSTTITITDNASSTGNPIDNVPFFVRQNYIDFLGREPDSFGQGWQSMLNTCASGDISCDRIEVSSRFFRSAEFQERGYFVYRFYSASFGRKPNYEEFIPDVAKVSGFLTEAEKEANKVAFVDEFMQRTEFRNKYDSTLNNPTAYVNALIASSGLSSHPSHDGWIAGLQNGSLTRAQVLRQLAESQELSDRYRVEAFVVMQYFGYLRRNPDSFYLKWIEIMNQDPLNYRNMVNGFMNSTEYRQRFAQ
jgi:subtilisin family serine protease